MNFICKDGKKIIIEITKEQADILMNILLNEMQYCENQNTNIYELLKEYREKCHKIYTAINNGIDD